MKNGCRALGREYPATWEDAIGGETGTFLVRVAAGASWTSEPGLIEGMIARPGANS